MTIPQAQRATFITLGAFALGKFMPGEKAGKARGKLRNIDGRHIYPVMHPAAGLRRTEFRDYVKADFKAIPAILRAIDEAPPEREKPATPEPSRKTPAENTANQATLF